VPFKAFDQEKCGVRTLWEEMVSTRAFWLSYVCAGVDFRDCASLSADQRLLYQEPTCRATLTFLLPDAYRLRLEVELGEHRLQLVHPGLVEPILLGTMDCHQMSDLFRWEEFLNVTRSLARNSVPAWAHELLLSFYVAVTEDCADQHLTMLRRCLDAAKVFSGVEIEYIIAYTRRVAVRRDFRWIDTLDLGWVAEGLDAYSLRRTEDGFSLGRFRDFMKSVEIRSDTTPSAIK